MPQDKSIDKFSELQNNFTAIQFHLAKIFLILTLFDTWHNTSISRICIRLCLIFWPQNFSVSSTCF